MAITAKDVNELRSKTGAGMMDCKKALTEADGNIEKAIDILRKKGAAVAAKRADKAANEGIVLTAVSENKKRGFIVEVNCETDFVAKSDDFMAFVNFVLEKIQLHKPSSVDDLLAKEASLQTKLDEIVGKIGEKVVISRIGISSAENGYVAEYVHPGAKLGVLITFINVPTVKFELVAGISKDIAMQVAAMKPLAVYRDEVDQDVVNKEIEIYKELARKEGKPEQILEKISTGRINKFYQENCLFEQAFIKDNTKTVGDLLKEINSSAGAEVKIQSFLRFHLGDEKK